MARTKDTYTWAHYPLSYLLRATLRHRSEWADAQADMSSFCHTATQLVLALVWVFQWAITKETSSPKGNDAHLRAIIQSEKKWKHQFFRRLRAANSVVHGQIWTNFKLIQALMYVIITCKYEKDPIKNNREKVAKPFFKL